MKKKISNAILKRLDALSDKVVSTPAVTFIKHDGGVCNVVEHYYSSRGNIYRHLTVASPDDYVSKGGLVIIDDVQD